MLFYIVQQVNISISSFFNFFLKPICVEYRKVPNLVRRLHLHLNVKFSFKYYPDTNAATNL